MSDDQRVSSSRDPFLSQLSTGQYNIAVAVVGALVVFGLIRFRFCYTPSVPEKPRKPKTVATTADTTRTLQDRKADPRVYQGHLKTDAETANVAAPSAEQIGATFKYTRTRPNAQLSPTGRNFIESAGLRLEVTKRKKNNVWILVLAIENPHKDHYLAYRVHTRPTSRGAAIRGATSFCARRELIDHNAMAIRPNQTITRAECIYRRGMGLEIVEVETMVVPALSYFYVSKLIPTSIGVEARETAKHSLPAGAGKSFCKLIASSSVVRQIERKQITWQQLVDYFSRHNCAIYRQFPEGYKAFTRNEERKLPIIP